MIEVKKRFRVQEKLVNSDKAIFVFTALGTKIGNFRPFVKAMNKRGYSCIVYDYPMTLITNARIDEWQACLNDVTENAQLRITKLEKLGVKSFSAHGSSMGTLFAGLLTRKSPKISHTILNLPYGDVAYSVFTSKPPRRAKEKFVKDGVTQEEVAKALAFVDPIKTAPDFKNKKILVYTSKRDSVLKYSDARRTGEALKEHSANLTYIENNRLGHYGSGVKNLLSIKRLVKFLES